MRAASLLVLVLFFSSCTAAHDELQFNLGAEVSQLDWNSARDEAAILLLDNLMEGLTTYASSLQGEKEDHLRPVPALASSWTISEEGRLYRFHLRKGLIWSDGTPLIAQHFVDSWERLLSPQAKIPNAYHLFDIVNAREYAEGKIADFSEVGVKAIDPEVLEVRLRRAAPYFLHLVASVSTYPIRKDLIEKLGGQWSDPEKLVTLGPYQIQKWSRDMIVLKNYQDYWGPKPTIKKVFCRLVSEPITALAMYENDMLDILPKDLPSSFGKPLQSHTDYRTGPKLSVSYLVFNTKRPPFDKVQNRRAFIQAMNRALFASFFQGAQTPTSSWIPPGMIGYRSDLGVPANGVESAKLKKQDIELYYSGNDTWNLVFQSMQKFVQEKLQAKLRVEQKDPLDYRRFLEKMALHHMSAQLGPHIFYLSWVADYPDAHSFMNVFTSTSESNYAGWSNARYDALVEKAVSVEDDSTRNNLYVAAQKLLLEDEAVIMPLFFTSHQALIKPEFKGVTLNILDKWYFKNIYYERDWLGWGRAMVQKMIRNKSPVLQQILGFFNDLFPRRGHA